MAIIKCPECGREVSSLAATCPHCGIVIKDNVVVCPNCGATYIKGTHTACDKCGAPLNNTSAVSQSADGAIPAQSAPASSAGTARGPEQTPTPPKASKRNRIIIICLVALIVVIGGGTFLYLHSQNNRQEQADYDMLMDNFNVADAETFLLKYPDTSHAQEIQDEIGRYKRYEQEWNLIANSSNINDFASFRSRFPNSPFDQLAYDKIDSLDWVSALKAGTEQALQNYLSVHPDGKYADEAQDAKQILLDSKPTADEQNAVSTTLTRYFTALADHNKEALTNITTAAVYEKSSDFIDQRNLTEIVNYNITSPIQVEKSQGANGQTFTASCTVSRTVTDAQGNVSSKEFTAKITLNQLMQIASINLHAFAQ